MWLLERAACAVVSERERGVRCHSPQRGVGGGGEERGCPLELLHRDQDLAWCGVWCVVWWCVVWCVVCVWCGVWCVWCAWCVWCVWCVCA